MLPAERLAGGSQPLQPITPGALLASALASNPAFTPALSGDGSGNLERRHLEFGTPASLSLGPFSDTPDKPHLSGLASLYNLKTKEEVSRAPGCLHSEVYIFYLRIAM